MKHRNNAYNTKRIRSDNKAGNAGVYFDKNRGRWHATITVHTRRIHLGRYSSKSMAVKVRKNAEEFFLGMVE